MRLCRALGEVQPLTVADFFRLAAAQIRRELLDLARRHTRRSHSGAQPRPALDQAGRALPAARPDPPRTPPGFPTAWPRGPTFSSRGRGAAGGAARGVRPAVLPRADPGRGSRSLGRCRDHDQATLEGAALDAAGRDPGRGGYPACEVTVTARCSHDGPQPRRRYRHATGPVISAWEELPAAGRKSLSRGALLHLPRTGRRARQPQSPYPRLRLALLPGTKIAPAGPARSRAGRRTEPRVGDGAGRVLRPPLPRGRRAGRGLLARNADSNREWQLKFLKPGRAPRPCEPPAASSKRPRSRGGWSIRVSCRFTRQGPTPEEQPLLRHAVYPGRDPPERHRRLPYRRAARPRPLRALTRPPRIVEPLRVGVQHGGLRLATAAASSTAT